MMLGMVAHAFNPSTLEAEASISLISSPVWSIEQVLRQPGLYGKTQSQQGKKKGGREREREGDT